MKKEKWFGLLLAVGLIALLMVQPADSKKSEDPTVEQIKAIMTEMNLQLESMGENVRVGMVEYYTALDKAGQIVYFDDRTKQLGSHWIPYDGWRNGVRDIYWLSDLVAGTATGVTEAETQSAVSNAMDTWEGVKCSDIPLIQLPDYDIDWGYVQWLLGMGGVPGWFADITQAGWLPRAFFDVIAEDGGDYILGATFTFIWVDAVTGEPTDMDNNKKRDVAFREIYYNNNFTWSIDPSINPGIDVETVVLHETGHGLSQGHFGKLFQTDANGKFHFAPRAVMNAGYTGVQREIKGTDNGGHCSIWVAWPNK